MRRELGQDRLRIVVIEEERVGLLLFSFLSIHPIMEPLVAVVSR